MGELPGWNPASVAVDYLESVDSTSSELKRRLAAGQLSGTTVLLTDHQTAGRGTHGRDWVQQAGRDIAVSIAARDDTPGFADPRLPLAVGAAAAVSLEAALPMTGPGAGWAGLRWPNDLCAGDPPQKFGGLLLERSQGWVIIGIGMNVNSRTADLVPELAAITTTLGEVCGAELDRGRLVAGFIARLITELGLDAGQPAGLQLKRLLGSWQERDRTAGKRYRLASTGEIVIASHADIASGNLLCETASGKLLRVTSYRELIAIPAVC
jgi:BirA family biotin operon repressor/biotin-[acetyl-CoA-carboxylase] ligase